MTAAGYQKTLGATAKPIPVGPELLVFLDQTKRLDFLKQWQQAIKGLVLLVARKMDLQTLTRPPASQPSGGTIWPATLGIASAIRAPAG